MNSVHPAFSHFPNPEVSEALSAPFIGHNEYTVFDGSYTFRFDAGEITPLVVGGMILREGGCQFMAGVSQHSTIPLNHMVRYLNDYGDQVSKTQAPIFEELGAADGSEGLKMIAAIQSNVFRIAEENRMRVVSGFVLGLTGEPQVKVAGLVVGTKALDSMQQIIEAGFEGAESVFERAYAEEAEDYGGRESMREELVNTAKAHTIPHSVGRILPELQVVRNGLIEASPRLGKLFAMTGKAQRKALRAEKLATSNFN